MNKHLSVTDYKNGDFYFLHLIKQGDKGRTALQWHSHPFYEIVFIADGENEYVIENKEYALKKGDVLLVKPGLRHFESEILKAPIELYCLGFSADDIENGSKAKAIFERGEYFSVGIDSPFESLLNATKEAFSSSVNKRELFIRAICEAAVELLSDAALNKNSAARVKNRQLADILGFINRNLTSIKSSGDIEAATFFSNSYLRTLFKREMGIGIMEYVRNKKVLLAHSKIKDGAKPTEVYLNCGFSNYPTFYRAYTAYFGYSPKGKKAERG
jgi:AraC-like DNA-binding protein